GGEAVSTVLLIWVGMLVLAFFAWWAGRHRLAHPQPDAMPGATARTIFALIGVLGMMLIGFSPAVGLVLVAGGIGGWIWAAWRSGGVAGLRERLLRDPRPFVPLLLLIAVPRLLIGGPAFVVGATLALPSGVGQQLFYLLGLFAPLEALRQRTDVAAVVSALLFALLHVPFVMEANDGDIAAALANVVLFQASVGIIACLAFVRHRAAVPIGVAHALAIG
ncbi:MAG: type II CAAX prenyl endopeptidase Rce1 family protein, partial [Chloroflexota bacterium]